MDSRLLCFLFDVDMDTVDLNAFVSPYNNIFCSIDDSGLDEIPALGADLDSNVRGLHLDFFVIDDIFRAELHILAECLIIFFCKVE